MSKKLTKLTQLHPIFVGGVVATPAISCSNFNTVNIVDILGFAYPLTCSVPVDPDFPFEDRDTTPAFPELFSVTCVSSLSVSQVIKTTPLDNIKLLPCSLEVPPSIPYNPDQRDTLFPAVTPKITTQRFSSRGCIAASTGSTTQNDDIGSDSLSTTELDDDGWIRPGSESQQVVQTITVLARIGFDTTNGLWGFYRDHSYNSCGELISISPETAKKIDDVSGCTG